MENILFITSDFKYQGNTSKIKQSQEKFINMISKSSMNTGNAFFINSLKTIGNVSILFGVQHLLEIIKNHKFSIIVIDIKLFLSVVEGEIIDALNSVKSKKILFISNDGNFSLAYNVKKIDQILNISAIFVTNLLKDLNHYNLPPHIIAKMHLSYLGLGFLNIKYDLERKIFINIPIFDNLPQKKYDCFFAGSSSSTKKIRSDFLLNFNKDDRREKYNMFIIDFSSGQNNMPLTSSQFIEKLKLSNTALDLSGQYDNLTMRFNEIVLCNELPLVDKGFKKFKISDFYGEILKEFSFENIDQFYELIEKFKNPKVNERIKLEISNIFHKYYNPKIHGADILNKL